MNINVYLRLLALTAIVIATVTVVSFKEAPQKVDQVILYSTSVPVLVKDVVRYQNQGYHVANMASQSIALDNYLVSPGTRHYNGTECGQVIIIMEKNH